MNSGVMYINVKNATQYADGLIENNTSAFTVINVLLKVFFFLMFLFANF